MRWIRSYVVAEESGELGTFCIYEAESPEAIRAHGAAADLPVDESCRLPTRSWCERTRRRWHN